VRDYLECRQTQLCDHQPGRSQEGAFLAIALAFAADDRGTSLSIIDADIPSSRNSVVKYLLETIGTAMRCTN